MLEQRTIEIQPGTTLEYTRPWHVSLQGGVQGSPSTTSLPLFGGGVGVLYAYLGAQFRATATAQHYAISGSSDSLFFDLRLLGGVPFEWSHISLWFGGYLGPGLLLQDVTRTTRPGLVLEYGAVLQTTYWFHPSFGLGLQVEAGFYVLSIGNQWHHLFAWSVQSGVRFRL